MGVSGQANYPETPWMWLGHPWDLVEAETPRLGESSIRHKGDPVYRDFFYSWNHEKSANWTGTSSSKKDVCWFNMVKCFPGVKGVGIFPCVFFNLIFSGGVVDVWCLLVGKSTFVFVFCHHFQWFWGRSFLWDTPKLNQKILVGFFEGKFQLVEFLQQKLYLSHELF